MHKLYLSIDRRVSVQSPASAFAPPPKQAGSKQASQPASNHRETPPSDPASLLIIISLLAPFLPNACLGETGLRDQHEAVSGRTSFLGHKQALDTPPLLIFSDRSSSSPSNLTIPTNPTSSIRGFYQVHPRSPHWPPLQVCRCRGRENSPIGHTFLRRSLVSFLILLVHRCDIVSPLGRESHVGPKRRQATKLGI